LVVEVVVDVEVVACPLGIKIHPLEVHIQHPGPGGGGGWGAGHVGAGFGVQATNGLSDGAAIAVPIPRTVIAIPVPTMTAACRIRSMKPLPPLVGDHL
jgi:hypothetical protein